MPVPAQLCSLRLYLHPHKPQVCPRVALWWPALLSSTVPQRAALAMSLAATEPFCHVLQHGEMLSTAASHFKQPGRLQPAVARTQAVRGLWGLVPPGCTV